MTGAQSVSENAGNNAVGGSAVVGNSRFCIGKISGLRLKDDDFNAWVERFELYANLNEISKHKKKLMFLTLLGNDGYSLVRDLCTPRKPLELSYDDLKQSLDYINPKPNLITERYKFKERKQAADESIIQFATSLKKMSEFCEFATSLNESLRDQFIWGVKDSNIKKKLLA
ncbi:uncharacterized protein LOC132938406 [Metopolophium dirhodum]|uniref:uncharacterized protein LOC132938406 n=1 Tax=Metopolophium dirhodum TaxID=44670 RepID=UPI00298FED2B|nr:uncharacterized protein LOC132938406 [Metopolophium dirhodum]